MTREASANAEQNQSQDPKKRQQEYEINLLARYIQYVKETGRIDYPDLKEFILPTCEVEAAPEGTVLLPEDISILAENVRTAQANIVTVALELYLKLVKLKESKDVKMKLIKEAQKMQNNWDRHEDEGYMDEDDAYDRYEYEGPTMDEDDAYDRYEYEGPTMEETMDEEDLMLRFGEYNEEEIMKKHEQMKSRVHPSVEERKKFMKYFGM